MNKKAIIELCKCRMREFFREPSAATFVIGMPILWMLALGYAFENPSLESYGIAYVAKSDSELSKFESGILASLKNDTQINLSFGTSEEVNLQRKRGKIDLSLENEGAKIIFKLDPKNPTSVRAKAHVNKIIQKYAGREDIIETSTSEITSRGFRYIDWLIPGLLGLSIMSTSLFGVGMTIVSNRKENMLKRYMTTPMKPGEFIFSHIFGRLFNLTIEFLAIIIFGMLIFNFNVDGSLITLFLVAILGASSFTAISLFFAARTTVIPVMLGLANITMIVMIVLGGVFFSNANFPQIIQPFLTLLPISALVNGLRKVSLEGANLLNIWYEISILLGYTAIFSIITKLRFKWH